MVRAVHMVVHRGGAEDKGLMLALGPWDIGRVHHADFVDGLRGVPDGSLDAILTDPPYGATQNPWDKPVSWPEFFREAWRALGPVAPIVALVNFETACEMRLASDDFRYEIVCPHNQPTGHLNASIRPMVAHLFLVVFCREPPPWYPQMSIGPDTHGRRAKHEPVSSATYGSHEHTLTDTTLGKWPTTVHPFVAVHPSVREHSSEKPVDLAEWMIRSFTEPGSLVCDPFCGGGWQGIAAHRTARRFIGFDSDPASVDLANRRIAAEYERLGEVKASTAGPLQQLGLLAGLDERKP